MVPNYDTIQIRLPADPHITVCTAMNLVTSGKAEVTPPRWPSVKIADVCECTPSCKKTWPTHYLHCQPVPPSQGAARSNVLVRHSGPKTSKNHQKSNLEYRPLQQVCVCRGRVSNSRPPDYEYCLSWRTLRVCQVIWHSNQAELPRLKKPSLYLLFK